MRLFKFPRLGVWQFSNISTWDKWYLSHLGKANCDSSQFWYLNEGTANLSAKIYGTYCIWMRLGWIKWDLEWVLMCYNVFFLFVRVCVRARFVLFVDWWRIDGVGGHFYPLPGRFNRLKREDLRVVSIVARLVSLTLKCISSIVAANSLFDSCVVSSHKLVATLHRSHASDGLSFFLCKCFSFVSAKISSWIVDLQVVWRRQEGGLPHEGEESQTYRFCSFMETVKTTNTEMSDSRDVMIDCYQRVESCWY